MLASVADIILVAYLIYRILLLIKGTRAQQVLLGLAVLVGAAFFAKLLGLRTFSWILDTFFSSFLLVVVVVFQNDIRRGLSRVGRRTFLGGEASNSAELVDELCNAAEAMSRDRTGALILIERDADLTELADTGVEIDAKVSHSLLVQTFTVPGPLHDGAVIIQRGRITAASVFLPLTDSMRIDVSLGTRHRAAVGITEEWDAIALVVSEETGHISFVEGGHLTRAVEPVVLRRLLMRYIGIEGATSKWKWRIPTWGKRGGNQ
jgi:diadenylate cyclase